MASVECDCAHQTYLSSSFPDRSRWPDQTARQNNRRGQRTRRAAPPLLPRWIPFAVYERKLIASNARTITRRFFIIFYKRDGYLVYDIMVIIISISAHLNGRLQVAGAHEPRTESRKHRRCSNSKSRVYEVSV